MKSKAQSVLAFITALLILCILTMIALGGFAVVGGAIALIVFFMTRTKKTK